MTQPPPQPRRDREAAAVLGTVALVLASIDILTAIWHHDAPDLVAEGVVGVLATVMLLVAWAVWTRPRGDR